MKVAIIGRSEWLFYTANSLLKNGHSIPLIVTATEAPEYKITAQHYSDLAASIGAKFIKTSKINQADVVEIIKNIPELDIAISINYSGIIDQAVIDLFKLGILNAHGGDLPRYRGNACQAWAIINREKRIGLCVHKMIGGELDSGNIIARSYYELSQNTRIGEVYSWMENEIPNLMLDAVNNLSGDPSFVLEKQSLDPKAALRCYPRIPEDGKIDWLKSNCEILSLINASSEPFNGAFCEKDADKLIIWRAEIEEDAEHYVAVPGQVSSVNISDGSITVITGQGKLKIREIEFQGHRTLSPAQLIKSIRTRLK